ncbi:hypothetical protein [Conexibacter sp. SYSU D00693]|uniref:hypothetical protein n=1 Tax=Conexibacter sp. SYSU D00693 TaxID=2812560 RepID=UPI00196A822F|nr:hypothetical protein [Conexibacter sp. SYSU D00693]
MPCVTLPAASAPDLRAALELLVSERGGCPPALRDVAARLDGDAPVTVGRPAAHVLATGVVLAADTAVLAQPVALDLLAKLAA